MCHIELIMNQIRKQNSDNELIFFEMESKMTYANSPCRINLFKVNLKV
jgi:hypothetical protein